jgi:outer membrane murein-binding lipoprotein Lpp
MKLSRGQLRNIIREAIISEIESRGDDAYVGPYVVAGTQAGPGSGDESEQMCDQLASELVSLNKQLEAPGADVQSIQKQIELTTKTQAQTCEK